MSQSGAVVRPPYIYGEILSRSLSESPLSELPSLGRCLSQGMVVGAFIAFWFPVLGMLLHPENRYNFLLISWLPLFLATGIGFGLLEGLFIWACSYIAGHVLNALARATVSIVVLAILVVIFNRLYSDPPAPYDPYLPDWLRLVDFYSPVGVAFGLLIGSRFNPVNELLRGTTPPRWLALNGITGVVLRVLVIYATMQSTLILIWMTQDGTYPHKSIFMTIAVGHCVMAIVILFTRMPFWLLLLLALLINFPVVVLITDVLTNEIAQYAVIVYLALWAVFLLCRVSVAPAVLSFLKKEIRYYLID
jgi:hypothetical protein